MEFLDAALRIKRRRTPLERASAWLLLAAASTVFLATQPAPCRAEESDAQNAAALGAAAENYLRSKLIALPGAATITIDPPKVEHLAPCTTLAPFMSMPVRVRPRMSVGVRCTAPQAWTTYVQATVSIAGQYYVAARPLGMGQVVAPDDLTPRDADLATLSPDTIVDLNQAVGMRLASGMVAGQALRASNLRSAQAIQRGQNVSIVVNGPGFKATSEGEALANATPGERVQVRTASGQIVSGVLRRSGQVEVSM
jgi:flagella basal body P-ring formation protein FlgA